MKTSSALPDRIADFFVANIACERIRPGSKLPPYRVLAEQLNVDQTSLRSALRILVRMGLISPVQGSGMTVNNYHQVAGLDLLDNLFQIEELELGQELLNSTFDLFVSITPRILQQVLPSLSDDARLRVSTLLSQLQKAASDDAGSAELAELDVAIFEVVSLELQGLLYQLAANSSRTVRFKLTRQLYESVDANSHVAQLKGLFIGALLGEISQADIEHRFRDLFVSATNLLRQNIKDLPLKPSIAAAILPGVDAYFELN
ncbi:FadR family transcriptional regulator [Pseudomaricurvus alkylphenolicus]|uniref:GntR family transcriptional regulator n=1 Tax=Pseudomaricurvus alkylphenolicus TaxID=1306991 RepID=UPI00142004E5|nr:GntR family transcriptional regulator [Pseudomaricurvus alkylphenolicus]NIB40410.1 FadR family transcriptional regulator [Pseudomaricurvus alkylphenolicus]